MKMWSTNTAFSMTLVIIATSITSTVGECFCTAKFEPVCATNGLVFPNACVLLCYNSENNENLGIEKIGHCDEYVPTPTAVQEMPINGAADICQFTKDYRERWNFVSNERNLIIKKEKSSKARHYFYILAILCCVECAVLALLQLFYLKMS